MTYFTPAERLCDEGNSEAAIAGSQVFHKSSRITALEENRSKSIGASCNVYKLDDTMDSIADGARWYTIVQSFQGAPSVDFSELRPRGSKLGSGGEASGAVSFMIPYDAWLSVMKREEKKNSAGMACLDWKHPELEEFLKLKTKTMYKAVYIPHHDTSEATWFKNSPQFTLLAEAYEKFQCFLVKRPKNLPDGTELFINLCTEVVIPHKGYCVLGANNLGYYDADTLHFLPHAWVNASIQMLDAMEASHVAAKGTVLECDSIHNKQFGLGAFGLATLLGRLGVTYKQLANAFEAMFDSGADDIRCLANYQEGHLTDTASELVYWLTEAYKRATILLDGQVERAFCFQPTVSTAQRAFDVEGFHVSPELQPVIGMNTGDCVRTIIKSQIKGDKVIDYAPTTPTVFDTPYRDYARVSGYFQMLINSTGLAHRHSHCFYGELFTQNDLLNYYNDPVLRNIESLYYRLNPLVNVEALKADELWQEIDENELYDGSMEAIMSLISDSNELAEGFYEEEVVLGCGLPTGNQTPDSSECDCKM